VPGSVSIPHSGSEISNKIVPEISAAYFGNETRKPTVVVGGGYCHASVYLPLIIFEAMFETNFDKRKAEVVSEPTVID